MISKRTEGKIKAHYGMKDYYKFYCKDNPNKVSAAKFNKVMSECNEGIVNLIINQGLEYIPIKIQMIFCVRKTKRIPRIKNGKLVNTNPIDWKATLELWDTYEESKENKTIIRYLNNHTSRNIFRIKALKTGLHYPNKKLYKFKAVRGFSRSLGVRIFDPNKDNFEAYELYKTINNA